MFFHGFAKMLGSTVKSDHLSCAHHSHWFNQLRKYRFCILLVFLPLSVLHAQSAIDFPGSTAVTQSSAPLFVDITIVGSGTVQAAVVVDQGVPGVDFAVGSGGTCTSGAQYPLGQHCTVAVLFQPRYPGLCAGAVEILGTNGQLLGSTLVSALATGSLPVFLPGNINLVAGNGFWTYAGDGMSAL